MSNYDYLAITNNCITSSTILLLISIFYNISQLFITFKQIIITNYSLLITHCPLPITQYQQLEIPSGTP